MTEAYQISIHGLADVHEYDRPQAKSMVIKARGYFLERNLVLEWASMRPSEVGAPGYHLYASVEMKEGLTPEAMEGIAKALGEFGFEIEKTNMRDGRRLTFKSRAPVRPARAPVSDPFLRRGIEGVGAIRW